MPRGSATREAQYEPLTPLMCARLAAPHTWPGPSVLTTVFGGVYSIAAGYAFDAFVWCLLLAVAVAAQSAVNTLNDWADFRAGTDTVENSDDPTDAVLVYNNPNPRHVLALGIGYLGVALVCGLACTWWSGTWLPIAIGAVGALAVVVYSNGKVKISYLPLGEVVSGVVMGCLIPLADICVFAGRSLHGQTAAVLGGVDWLGALAATGPFVIGIGLVMATQNNCDIERDAPIGRRTLAVVLGRERSRLLYRAFAVFWVACVLHLSFWQFGTGFWSAVVLLVLGAGTLRAVLVSPLTHEVRGPSMGAINKANLFVNGAYVMSIMVTLMLG